MEAIPHAQFYSLGVDTNVDCYMDEREKEI